MNKTTLARIVLTGILASGCAEAQQELTTENTSKQQPKTEYVTWNHAKLVAERELNMESYYSSETKHYQAFIYKFKNPNDETINVVSIAQPIFPETVYEITFEKEDDKTITLGDISNKLFDGNKVAGYKTEIFNINGVLSDLKKVNRE